MANKIPRVSVREQEPAVRATNFEEVCYGYNAEEAQLEATRCLNCKNPRCVAACPVNINIPAFIHKVAEGDFASASAIIAEDSSLPSICGRVCPQETQCEGSCILGIKGEAVAIDFHVSTLHQNVDSNSAGFKCIEFAGMCVIIELNALISTVLVSPFKN